MMQRVERLAAQVLVLQPAAHVRLLLVLCVPLLLELFLEEHSPPALLFEKTSALLLLELLLATGLSLSDIMTTLFMGIVVVVCGLVGALVHSSYKWGYFVMGVVALFYVW